MSLEDINGKDFLRWEVKPIWRVYYPSSKIGTPEDSFTIFGVNRGALDIVRNWEKVNSVEVFNQGWVKKPSDMTFTIAVKERSESFEKLRRLSKSGAYFDIECDILRRTGAEGGTITHGSNQHDFGNEEEDNFVHWLDGFEKYIGCVVNREGQTVEIATMPVREFEIVFLDHVIKESISGNFNSDIELEEGDGSNPTLDDINL